MVPGEKHSLLESSSIAPMRCPRGLGEIAPLGVLFSLAREDDIRRGLEFQEVRGIPGALLEGDTPF